MAYMAFDPMRVEMLRRSLADSLTELDALSHTDAEAATAMRAISQARTALREAWLPIVGDVLRCRALTQPDSARLSWTDLRNAVAYQRVAESRWIPMEDPSMWPQLLTPSEAAAVGERLNDADISSLLDTPGEREWLYRQLQTIAANPELTAAFLSTFTEWAALCNELAQQLKAARHLVAIEEADDSVVRAVAELEADFAALGTIYSSMPQPVVGPPYLPAIADMTTYAAAMLVSNLELDAATLAQLTCQILDRWRNGVSPGDGYETDWTSTDPNTADILYRALLDTPGACTEYVMLTINDPGSMWISAKDPELTRQVALEGTDPANISVADAGRVIQSWLTYFMSSEFATTLPLVVGYPDDYRLTLTEVISPYLQQFAATNREWGSGEATELRIAALAFLMEDGAVLDLLIERSKLLVEPLLTGGRSDDALPNVADLIGLISQLAVNCAVANERQRQELYDMLFTLATIPAAWLDPARGIAADLALSAAWDFAGDHLSFMPNPDETKANKSLEMERTLVATLTIVAATLWAQSGVSGDKPPQLDPTDESPLTKFLAEFRDWKEHTGDGSAQAAAAIEEVANTVHEFVTYWTGGVLKVN
jgi:hypothetical protein